MGDPVRPVRGPVRRAVRAYGANPLHLLALLASFAVAGYAVAHLVHLPTLGRIAVWFLAAVIGHDLILFPLYALADRSFGAALRALWPRRGAVARVPPLNYIRVPVLGTGLLFLVFLPGIIRQGGPTYHAATGQTQQPFLDRWLLLTAAMFALSAVAYAIRLRTAAGHGRASPIATPNGANHPPSPR
jgi:hypothetical protein